MDIMRGLEVQRKMRHYRCLVTLDGTSFKIKSPTGKTITVSSEALKTNDILKDVFAAIETVIRDDGHVFAEDSVNAHLRMDELREIKRIYDEAQRNGHTL